MQVTVNYFAQLKRAAGVGSEAVAPAPGCTLTQLVVQLAANHGNAFRAIVLDVNDQPQRALLYAVGDVQADLNRELRDGDIVTILAPMAGG